MLFIATVTDLPLIIIVPVLGALTAAIVVLFWELRKESMIRLNINKDFREKIIKITKNLTDTHTKLEEDFRIELKELINKAHENEIKIIEILYKMHETNDRVSTELMCLTQSMNGLNINITKSKG